MELKDGPAEADFRRQIRAWLTDTLPLLGGTEPHRLEDKRDYWGRWQRLLFDAGYAGLSWPTEFGGGGADAKIKAVFTEEMDRAGAPERLNIIGEDFGGPTIIAFGTPEQQQRYLRPILTGEHIWCQLFSEPESGSDLASLRTAAVKVDGGWKITGQKIWTSRAQLAAHAILLARTGGGPRHRGITYFLLDMAAPGVRVRPLEHMLGEAEFNEVFLDDVFIPDSDVVGDVDDGWRVAMGTLAFERVAIATGRVNTTGAVNDLIAEIAGLTGDDGRPLGADPLIRQRIADLYGRALTHYSISQRVISGQLAESPRDRSPRSGNCSSAPGRGHRRFRPVAVAVGRPVLVAGQGLHSCGRRSGTLAAAGQPGPGHRDRRRSDVHPAQHRRRAHSRHAQGVTAMSDYVWLPTPEYIDNANVTRLAHRHGLRDIAELRERSVADPAWYWNAVLDDLGIEFATPHTEVLDLSHGIEHPDWFVGAELNVVDACLRRWQDAGRTASPCGTRPKTDRSAP